MNIFGPDHKKLDAILRQAYRAREDAEAGDEWRERVMARVREADPLEPSTRFLSGFEELVWRLVPVTSLLALVLIGFLLTLGAGPADPLQPFLTSAEESMLAQIFGV